MARNYINNKDLYNALIEHRKNYDEAIAQGKTPPELPRYICESFMAIGNGIAKKPRFSSYSWKEDMISLGILDCVKYWKTFNPNKTDNPFAFFTAVFKAAFFRYNNKEEKEKYVKFKTCISKGIDGSSSDEDDDLEDHKVKQDMPYENIGTFVDEYEKRLDEQKNKQKSTAVQKKKPKTKRLF